MDSASTRADIRQHSLLLLCGAQQPGEQLLARLRAEAEQIRIIMQQIQAQQGWPGPTTAGESCAFGTLRKASLEPHPMERSGFEQYATENLAAGLAAMAALAP